ncbi:MAG: hypothetical protein V4510_09870 [bacterium]
MKKPMTFAEVVKAAKRAAPRSLLVSVKVEHIYYGDERGKPTVEASLKWSVYAHGLSWTEAHDDPRAALRELRRMRRPKPRPIARPDTVGTPKA